MPKPGPHPWATNDTYAAGPDTGSDTKTVPLSAHKEDGYYRTRRPAPDILNWQLNRMSSVERAVARIHAMNYVLKERTIDYNAGWLLTSCHSYDPTNDDLHLGLFHYDATNNRVQEADFRNGQILTETTPWPMTAITSQPTVADADGSDSGHRILTARWAGGNDAVVYATNYTPDWGWITFNPGPPSYDWESVACDRNTAGGASADWCIGCFVSAASPQIWSSTDGITFAVEAGFSASAGSSVHGLHHSCHPAGALGPDDTGNPIWIANVSGDVYRSVDHSTWSGPATLNGYDTYNPRSMAYSRISRRWVAVHSGTDFGDISYSDDNGASWTHVSNALAVGSINQASLEAHIAGDGYGTFVVSLHNLTTPSYPYIWVSVDEGMTWTKAELYTPLAAAADDAGAIIEPCFLLTDIDTESEAAGFFVRASYDDTATQNVIHLGLRV